MSDEDESVLIVTAAQLDRGSLPAGTLLAQHRGTGWRQAACIPLGDQPAIPLAEKVVAAATGAMRAALARVQPGLDMWLPHDKPRAAIGIIEYVTSAPETRQAYYDSQYAASGPAMRELWELGSVQRFVGFEVLEELMPTQHGGWDVLHITALAVRALPRMLFWTRRFDGSRPPPSCHTDTVTGQ